MTRLLVLNGSHSDIPLIEAGKRLGFEVITTGNAADLPGHQLADAYHAGDFSDRDEMLSLAQKLEIDAVCSCANDFGATTAAYIGEHLNIPGHDSYSTAVLLHNKDRFKQFARELNLSTPDYLEFRDITAAESALRNGLLPDFPVIVKPVDLTGGKGVSKVMSSADFMPAVKTAMQLSRENAIVVEDFIDGQLHSFNSFLINGEVAFAFSDNEYSYKNPYLVSSSAGPADDIEQVRDQLIAQINRITKKLSLVDGIFHIQYINARDAAQETITPQIIDITRRCSGDFYPVPVSNATGSNWAEWIVKAETGMDCSAFPAIKQSGFHGRHCIMAGANGVVENIVIDPEIKPNIVGKYLLSGAGSRINNYLTDKLGVLFLSYESRQEMLDKTQRINQLVRVEIS